MAFCKSRGNEFVILLVFTVSTLSTLIHCRSLSWTQTTSDEGETLSDMSDQETLYDQFADFDNPIDDEAFFDEASDEGDKTLSDMSDQETLYDQFADFVNPIDDEAFDEASDEGETFSDMSDQETLYDQFADFVNPIDDEAFDEASDEGAKTLSDMSDQETLYDQFADVGNLIDDAAFDLPSSTVMQEPFEGSSEVPWDEMSPKLKCDKDFMNLQLFGSGVDQVELCRDSSAPVPLGHLPPNCGHTSHTHGGLVYATPYNGCGVTQQGGKYVMQMQWQGIPVFLSCPMS